jgi:putative peptide zinc metalloprotease protein
MTRIRRTGFAVVLVAALAVGAPIARADDDEGFGGHNNVVKVVNQTDGATRTRSRVGVPEVGGETVDNQNVASAYASCTDCRTVAVAVQVVVVEGDVTTFTPGNAAVAVNESCLRCQTFAYARQEVLTPGTQVSISGIAQNRIQQLQWRIDSVSESDEAFDQMTTDLDNLTEELVGVVQGEIDRAGATAERHGERRVDERDD